MAAITQHPTAKTDFANPTTSQIIFIRKREGNTPHRFNV